MTQIYRHSIIDIRSQEYPALNDMTYLDHAGTTLYAKSLMHQFSKDMTSGVFGNPHSASPSSMLSTQRVEKVRLRVLSFFKADPEHFDVIFVANATAAIKLVLEAFRDVKAPGFWYGYHRDAHTSLVGLRQLAAQSRCFESDQAVEGWLEETTEGQKNAPFTAVGLFAYPAQSNMNGHRLPLDWPGRLRASSHAVSQKMYCLLDAAAYVTTRQLDLSNVETAPDFITLSFYKIFGFPDLGALIVRKPASDILQHRRYFGGGTVEMVTTLKESWHAKRAHTIHEQLEDGTLPFHSIIALDSAFNVHEQLYGSMDSISRHTCALASDLYNQLAALRHANGHAVCQIYNDPNSQYGNAKTQGPTIAFNVRTAQGGWIGKSEVESLAIVRNIHLRTGGACNPGGIATFCQLDYWEMRRNFSEGLRCGDDHDLLGGKPTGIVRVSLGAMSSQEDVQKFVNFVEEMFVEAGGTMVPAHILHPITPDMAESAVEKIQIFPVLGCSGWQVPRHVNWLIEEAALLYDREWCVVLKGGTTPLDHPAMKNIRPQIDIEKGTLKLTAPLNPSDASSNPSKSECYEEVIISLWDSPSQTIQPYLNNRHLADSYDSESIVNFFTAVIGIPSTLARFKKKIAESNWNDSVSPASVDRSPTVSAVSDGEAEANIMLSGSSKWKSHHYIRIGLHYFELIQSTALQTAEESRRLRHLPNKYDRSSAAQNSTICHGDYVQSFSADSISHDPALREAIASKFAGQHICTVWNCRRDFNVAEDLAAHLRTHKSRTVTKNSDGAVTNIEILLKPPPQRWKRWKLRLTRKV
ncbi:pyridoxal phosphate-dependent transferase [Lipomyces chichibuensis]|uniref:pyridoxal phosphate-dependent transferase n=1 Tax=Lipomyces chichibuensis TaxID=1546026 RepID=UPI0033435E85